MPARMNRRELLSRLSAVGLSSWLIRPLTAALDSAASVPQKPNVLFISVDDLRTQLGCYGHCQILSPYIDQLASQGVLFEKAYCQMPACGPSRASLMTGLYPFGNRFEQWRADRGAPEATTLASYFKANGYETVCNGKIFHLQYDSAESWSEPSWRVYDYDTEGQGDWGAVHFDKIWLDPASGRHRSQAGRGPYREAADVSDEAYEDGQVTRKCIADLHRLSRQDKPFFLACGFHRPHLPFNAPQRYYQLYDPDQIDLAGNRFTITDKPAACRNSDEIARYSQIDGWPDDEQFHRQARHAYYACVSYIDAQIGKLLETLKTLELDNNTIVVLWGDHGWLLGEHNFWGKHNTLNETLRVPLIVRVPHGQSNVRCTALVELVDLYPTLCELAGLPEPTSHTLDGMSLAPLLVDVNRPWKKAVFSAWSSGKAVKTDRYLYTEWADGQRMLFDHQTDPYENTNIAYKPESATVVARLSERLKTMG